MKITLLCFLINATLNVFGCALPLSKERGVSLINESLFLDLSRAKNWWTTINPTIPIKTLELRCLDDGDIECFVSSVQKYFLQSAQLHSIESISLSGAFSGDGLSRFTSIFRQLPHIRKLSISRLGIALDEFEMIEDEKFVTREEIEGFVEIHKDALPSPIAPTEVSRIVYNTSCLVHLTSLKLEIPKEHDLLLESNMKELLQIVLYFATLNSLSLTNLPLVSHSNHLHFLKALESISLTGDFAWPSIQLLFAHPKLLPSLVTTLTLTDSLNKDKTIELCNFLKTRPMITSIELRNRLFSTPIRVDAFFPSHITNLTINGIQARKSHEKQ